MHKTKTIIVDLTPSFSMAPDALENLRASSVGRPYSALGVKGVVQSARIEEGRLIAEVKLSPNVILG